MSFLLNAEATDQMDRRYVALQIGPDGKVEKIETAGKLGLTQAEALRQQLAAVTFEPA